MTKVLGEEVLKSVFRVKGNLVPGIRPAVRRFDRVEITPFRGGAAASSTISADFELSWAWRGWRTPGETYARAAQERLNIPHLLRQLEDSEVPITWATVGHLFLESCERDSDGAAHSNMPRPPGITSPPAMARWTGDWYAHDPCTDFRTDNLWYCPDLIRSIQKSMVKHELGSHSFSHISFLPANSDAVLVESELVACQAAMSKFGVRARSLVYPYNQMGHSYGALLARQGITCVRHRDPVVRLSYPERLPCGVYKLYESMNLRHTSLYRYADKARLFLEEAMKRCAAYHIWFHPSDPAELFASEFDEILNHIVSLRDQGRLWVATMGELAAYCEARDQTTLEVHRSPGETSVVLRSSYDAARYGETTLTLCVETDSSPSDCLIRIGDIQQSVKWVDQSPGGFNGSDYSFLVDVPPSASELRIRF